jgi:hypothetical protein
MRPCTLLKPWLCAEEIGRRLRRAADAGQLGDAVRRMFSSKQAWMMAALIESWPQPAHSVEIEPS